MATASHIPVTQRISSSPVNGYRAEVQLSSTDSSESFERGARPFDKVTKSTIASVSLAFGVGLVLLAGAAAVVSVALEWGARLLLGL